MNLPYEIQCASPYSEDGSEGETESAFTDRLHSKYLYREGTYGRSVKKYQIFPKELPREEYEKLMTGKEDAAVPADGAVSVGLDYVDFLPVRVDLTLSLIHILDYPFFQLTLKRQKKRLEILSKTMKD